MAVKLLDFGERVQDSALSALPWSSPLVGGVNHRRHDGCAHIIPAATTAHWATRRIETKK